MTAGDTYELVFVAADVGDIHVVSGGTDILLYDGENLVSEIILSALGRFWTDQFFAGEDLEMENEH